MDPSNSERISRVNVYSIKQDTKTTSVCPDHFMSPAEQAAAQKYTPQEIHNCVKELAICKFMCGKLQELLDKTTAALKDNEDLKFVLNTWEQKMGMGAGLQLKYGLHLTDEKYEGTRNIFSGRIDDITGRMVRDTMILPVSRKGTVYKHVAVDDVENIMYMLY